MPITFGRNLARTWGTAQWSRTVLMKAYTTHTELSDVFLSYRHTDKATAWGPGPLPGPARHTTLHRCPRQHPRAGSRVT